MTSLDSEIVNDRYSHVGMSFQTKRQDGNTDEKHWHYANTLKKSFIKYITVIKNKTILGIQYETERLICC